jgi:hypothetical protein
MKDLELSMPQSKTLNQRIIFPALGFFKGSGVSVRGKRTTALATDELAAAYSPA